MQYFVLCMTLLRKFSTIMNWCWFLWVCGRTWNLAFSTGRRSGHELGGGKLRHVISEVLLIKIEVLQVENRFSSYNLLSVWILSKLVIWWISLVFCCPNKKQTFFIKSNHGSSCFFFLFLYKATGSAVICAICMSGYLWFLVNFTGCSVELFFTSKNIKIIFLLFFFHILTH